MKKHPRVEHTVLSISIYHINNTTLRAVITNCTDYEHYNYRNDEKCCFKMNEE